ncbi:hypothetical protein CFD26_108287 [Aspergillus turcosus]|uniref:U6 snRNA phosphodiesterase n=1 Tax=Aspergillus turcosus TaxID=1245748 RepID=A0A3R7J8I7_9EURO|nr:hypothetical protein CFD26_108287 [Aspergillus turcosus]
MALVQYSDTESDTEESEEKSPRPAKKPRRNSSSVDDRASSLPPLPTAFHDLYASSTRVSVRDDPSLHGGRKRVIPHVEGNWPTHIYLEWYPSKGELAVLDDILSQVEAKLGGHAREIHSLLRSDLGVQLPLHISLSRPVVLRTEQRQPFLDMFQTALQESTVPAFSVNPYSLDWVSNYERTRWFLVLRVTKPANDNLNRLLGLSNRFLAHFGQPPLYADTQHEDLSHCFHVSLAWSLTEPSPEKKKQIEAIDLRGLRSLVIRFDCVKAKIGNNISSIPLSTEDLQAFQAKHFPSSQQVTSVNYTYSETVDEEFDDDDGLGYYPDGVKRTLTDEQIRIFRHSEIHSLLRAKQLREEELAEEARELTPVGRVAEGVTEGQERTPSGVPDGQQEKIPEAKEDTGLEPNEAQDSSIMEQSNETGSRGRLDYDDDATVQWEAHSRGSNFAGRRIISYDD